MNPQKHQDLLIRQRRLIPSGGAATLIVESLESAQKEEQISLLKLLVMDFHPTEVIFPHQM
jgi:hypothetical protein